MAVHEKVKALLGVEMNLFRPPFGEYNNNVIQAADECSYYTIQWDIDSHDWMNKGMQKTPQKLYQLLLKGLKKKDLNLCRFLSLLLKTITKSTMKAGKFH